jgi:hypothetical protein
MADISSYLLCVTGKWVKYFAQDGLTAKGTLYCLLGIFTFMAAFEPASAGQTISRVRCYPS